MKAIKKNCNPVPLLLSALISAQISFSQTKLPRNKPTWRDTAFIPVALTDTLKDSKIIVFNVGKKAIIYITVNAVRSLANEGLANELSRDANRRTIDFLDSATQISDSVFMYDLNDFDWYVSAQLQTGSAKVYYKKYKMFVDTIFHRQERYGSTATRFFYLPDKRPFFSEMEFIGILDKDGNDGFFSGRYLREYTEEGRKLQSLREE